MLFLSPGSYAGDCDVTGLLQKKAEDTLETSDECRGFDVCPSWPMPYKHGDWV